MQGHAIKSEMAPKKLLGIGGGSLTTEGCDRLRRAQEPLSCPQHRHGILEKKSCPISKDGKAHGSDTKRNRCALKKRITRALFTSYKMEQKSGTKRTTWSGCASRLRSTTDGQERTSPESGMRPFFEMLQAVVVRHSRKGS